LLFETAAIVLRRKLQLPGIESPIGFHKPCPQTGLGKLGRSPQAVAPPPSRNEKNRADRLTNSKNGARAPPPRTGTYRCSVEAGRAPNLPDRSVERVVRQHCLPLGGRQGCDGQRLPVDPLLPLLRRVASPRFWRCAQIARDRGEEPIAIGMTA